MSVLSQTFIVQAVHAFDTLICPLNAFSFGIKEERATVGDTVTVPFFANTSASYSFNYTDGYASEGNTITSKQVTLDNLLYQKTVITDDLMAKMDDAAISKLAVTMGNALARDVISSSFSKVVTEANFPTSASITQTQLTSSVGLSNLVTQADTLKYTVDRGMVLSPEAYGNLLKNPDVNQAFSYGNSDAIQKGLIPNVFGFAVNKVGVPLPVVAEPAKGLVLCPSAILLASGNHAPAPDSKNLVECTQQVSANGVAVQLKRYYDPTHASTVLILESLTGTAKGEDNALVWLK